MPSAADTLTPFDPSQNRDVVSHFAAAVRSYGTRIALTAGVKTVTYAELDRLTDALAAKFSHLGAGPGAYVGLLSARSIDAIAVMLAVLKAGAAYLPLDPSYPADANARMLADCRPKVLVGQL